MNFYDYKNVYLINAILLYFHEKFPPYQYDAEFRSVTNLHQLIPVR